MKIIGKFREFPLTEVILYGTPIYTIQELLKNDINIEKKIQEYKPRKFKPAGHEEFILPDRALRHQIVLSKEVSEILKIKLYSTPMSAEAIRLLKLEPIESAEKKERLARSLKALTSNLQSS